MTYWGDNLADTNLDEILENADWPKQTPDLIDDLPKPEPEPEPEPTP